MYSMRYQSDRHQAEAAPVLQRVASRITMGFVRGLTGLLLLSLFGALLAGCGNPNAQEEFDQLTADVLRLNKERTSLKDSIVSLELSKSSSEDELATETVTLTKRTADLEAVEAELEENSSDLDAARRKEESLLRDIAAFEKRKADIEAGRFAE